MSNKIKIIAETAFSHEGDINYVFEVLESLKNSGVTYIKFQMLLDINLNYHEDANIYEALYDKMFTEEEWIKILSKAHEFGFKTLVLAIGNDALQFIKKQSNLVDAIELHSISIADSQMIDFIGSHFNTDVNIFLGIGGHDLKTINYCVEKLCHLNLILVHGFQSFPTQKSLANLNKIISLRETFPDCKIGYADHTPWNEDDTDMLSIAITLGIQFYEKHIVLEKGKERSDFYSATDPKGIAAISEKSNVISSALGTSNLNKLSLNEKKYLNRQRKIVSSGDLEKGAEIKEHDLTFMVTNQYTDIDPIDYLLLIGKTAKTDIKKHQVITHNNIN